MRVGPTHRRIPPDGLHHGVNLVPCALIDEGLVQPIKDIDLAAAFVGDLAGVGGTGQDFVDEAGGERLTPVVDPA